MNKMKIAKIKGLIDLEKVAHQVHTLDHQEIMRQKLAYLLKQVA